MKTVTAVFTGDGQKGTCTFTEHDNGQMDCKLDFDPPLQKEDHSNMVGRLVASLLAGLSQSAIPQN